MRRKLRSPLHGATRNDIAALRAVIAANLAWERALGTPQQYLHPDEPIQALTSLSFHTVDRVRERSRRRWQQAPHFLESWAVREDQWLKQHDRRAWEQKQLRREIAGLRAEIDQMKGARA